MAAGAGWGGQEDAAPTSPSAHPSRGSSPGRGEQLRLIWGDFSGSWTGGSLGSAAQLPFPFLGFCCPLVGPALGKGLRLGVLGGSALLRPRGAEHRGGPGRHLPLAQAPFQQRSFCFGSIFFTRRYQPQQNEGRTEIRQM